MRFTAYEYTKIKRRNNLYKLLMEFAESELKCAELHEWNYVCAAVGARSLNSACAKYKIPHIKAVTKNGHIF